MKFWNVHRTDAGRLQNLLNAHAERGWDVHHIRSVGNNVKEHLMIVFVREFDSADARDAYLQERAARKAAAKKDAPVAEPVPA